MVNKEENYNTALEMLLVNNALIFPFLLFLRTSNRYLNGVFLLLGRPAGVGLWELLVSYKHIYDECRFLFKVNELVYGDFMRFELYQNQCVSPEVIFY